MNASVVPLLRVLLALLFSMSLPACVGGSSNGGSSGGTPCALDGTCPNGMVCAGQYCINAPDAGAQDGGTSTDGASSGGAATGADSAGSASDSGNASGKIDGGGRSVLDAGGSASSGGSDAGGGTGVLDSGSASGGGAALKIETLQKSGDSTSCANKSGQTKVLEGAKLEDAIVTQKPFKAGKSWIFHVRPVGASQVGGAFQGMKVFVYGGEPKVKIGDVVALTGDIVEYYCETEITLPVDKIVVVKSGPPLTPYAVKTSDITFDGDSEPYEGVFVIVQNVKVHEANYKGSDGKTHGGFEVVSQTDATAVVHVDLPSSSQFTKQDAGSKQLVTTMVKGQVLSSVTGHLNYSFGEFVLIPRDDADLKTQ